MNNISIPINKIIESTSLEELMEALPQRVHIKVLDGMYKTYILNIYHLHGKWHIHYVLKHKKDMPFDDEIIIKHSNSNLKHCIVDILYELKKSDIIEVPYANK